MVRSINSDFKKELIKDFLQFHKDDTTLIDSDAEDDPLLEESGPPAHLYDRYHMIKIITAFLGVVSVAPWNVFATATACWNYKFRNLTSSNPHDKSDLQIYFTSYLTIANNIPFMIVVCLMMFYGYKITATIRSVFSMLTMMALLIISTVLVKIDTDQWQRQFMILILGILVVLSICSSVLLSSLSGVMSAFPAPYITSLAAGQAGSGLLATIFQILSLLSHADPLTSSMYYFICADLLLVLTFVCYLGARRTPYYRYYRKRGMITVSVDTISQRSAATRSDLTIIVKRVWPYLGSTFFTFFFTMCVFPSVLVLVVPTSTDGPLTGDLFLPFHCFFFWNLGDLGGRLLAKWIPLPSTKPYITLGLSIARVIVAIALMFCNMPPSVRHNLVNVFHSDFIFAALVLIFGLSNGYLLNMGMINAPALVVPELREKTGFVLTTALAVGCLGGAISSNLLINVL